ncbi:hypothetical protein [Aneurinibacillus tyrosinisolvens]|uniref:hypothetical protein n=1 Tax=Aneurinibacillus tyrosinisolvens TaxID=1443435 RepID=UPI00063F9039|nr:hypothetical protein [Aneurinibacillus tyrosinisolvens]
MNQPFTSTNDDHPWLHAIHEKRMERSFELGKTTIDALIKEGKPVTLKNIHEKSKELDSTGKGIHQNTIRSNPDLKEYYQKHSNTYKQKEKSNKSKRNQGGITSTFDYRRLKPDRDKCQLQSKYMKLSKVELVQRLIDAEQYIAENNKQRVSKHFESFK